MNFLTRVEQAAKAGKLSPEIVGTLHSFHSCYVNAAAENGFDKLGAESNLKKFLELIAEQLTHPYPFELFHERVVSPFNYYKFGIDFAGHPAVRRVGQQHQVATGDRYVGGQARAL